MVVKDEKTDLSFRKNGNEDKSEIIGMYVPLEKERTSLVVNSEEPSYKRSAVI